MRRIRNLSTCLLLVWLIGCGATHQVRQATADIVDLPRELPEIAAEFTSRYQGEHAETRRWRFWRQHQRVDIESPSLATGESWQRDGNSLIKRQLFHRDHAVIEYQDDDLRMLAAAPSWEKLQLLLAPELLNRLRAGELDLSRGFPLREYQGMIGESEWRIALRLDLGLPVRIERRQHGFHEITELTAIYPLAAAPWQPNASEGYRIIDFADLGDREHDPLVMKLQAQAGAGQHQHSLSQQAD